MRGERLVISFGPPLGVVSKGARMPRSALERFRRAFRSWVRALVQESGGSLRVEADEVLERLEQCIPESTLVQIGPAFENGWLKSDRRRVQGSDCSVSGQHPVYASKGVVVPWWELYLQLADYGRLRSETERRGTTVRLEDHERMDITVDAGAQSILSDSRSNESWGKRCGLPRARVRQPQISFFPSGPATHWSWESMRTGGCGRTVRPWRRIDGRSCRRPWRGWGSGSTSGRSRRFGETRPGRALISTPPMHLPSQEPWARRFWSRPAPERLRQNAWIDSGWSRDLCGRDASPRGRGVHRSSTPQEIS